MHKVFGEKEDAVYYDRKGAYLIAVNEDKIAVIKTSKGYFLLGGGIDEGESDVDCIKRECLEEAGYAVEVKGFIGSAEAFSRHPRIGYFHPIQNYYFGELLEKVQTPIETDHVLVWMEYEKLENNMFADIQNWAIEECWKNKCHI